MELETLWRGRSMGWRNETAWKNQAGIFPVAGAGGREAEEFSCFRVGILGTRSLRGRWRGIQSLAGRRNCPSLWRRDRRQSGRTSANLGNRDVTDQHHGCPVLTGSILSPLSESSVRLGIGRKQQSETGIGFSGTYLSLAQTWRSVAVCHPAVAPDEMCQTPERAFRGVPRIRAHRTHLHAI